MMERRSSRDENVVNPRIVAEEALRAPVTATTEPPGPAPASAIRGSQPMDLLLFNAVLGAWLFLSAFLWPHSQPALVNAWVVGALLTGAGALAGRSAKARAFCGALALWLVVSAFFIPKLTEFTFWHDAAIGLAALVITFKPRRRTPADLLQAR
jgi:hypothetical protein